MGTAGHDAGDNGRPHAGRGRGVPAATDRSADVLLVIALAVDTVLAIVDAVTPIVLMNLLVFGPLVAAFRSRPRTTALVAVYAVVLALLEGVAHGFFGSADHLVRCAAIAATGVVAVWGSWQRERTARAEASAALLARAGAMLGGTPDHEATLRDVAGLVVPAAADRIAVDVVEADGVRRVASATAAPAADTAASDAAGLVEVVRTGEPVLLDETAILPLRARDAVVGVLTIGSTTAPPVPDSPALAFARELAAECATAIDNARLHQELRDSEEALRRSNDQLGAILGGVADGVLARDAAGQVVYANAAAAVLLSGRAPTRCAARRSARSPAGCACTTRPGASWRPATSRARGCCGATRRPTGSCGSRGSTPASSAGSSSRPAPSGGRTASCASCS